MLYLHFQRLLQSASVASAAVLALRMGGAVITLPLALRLVPPDELGLYYLFGTVTGMAVLIDLGLIGIVGRFAGYAWGGAAELLPFGTSGAIAGGGPNYELLEVLRRTVRRYYRWMALIVSLGLLGPGSWFVYERIRSADLDIHLMGAWLMFGSNTALALYFSYWGSMLNGMGKVAETAHINLFSQVGSLIILALTLLLGGGIWSYAISSFFPGLWVRYRTRRLYQIHAFPSGRVPVVADGASVFSALWPHWIRMGPIILSTFLIQRSSMVLVAAKLPLEDVASFGLTANLVNILVAVSGIPLNVAMPRINALRVSGDVPGIRALFLPRCYLGVLIGMLGVSALAFVAPTVLQGMGSQTHLLPAVVTFVMGVVFVLEMHHSAYATLVLSTNQNPFLVPAVVSGLAILAASTWAVEHFGVLGMILVQGGVQLAFNNWYPVLLGLKTLKSKGD